MSGVSDEAELDRLRRRMKELDDAFQQIYRAYYTHPSLSEKRPAFSDLKSAAEAFIAANHEYQRARFGRIRLKLSLSKLLR